MDIKEKIKLIYSALDEKKANDIAIIDISEISSMSDYFIVADGKNRNQVQALCDNVEDALAKNGISIKNREGYSNGGWILLDYYDIIVHIFSEEEREFYDIEHVWSDGRRIYVGEL